MTAFPPLTDATLTLENRIAVLTFNRHDVRNALTGTHLVDDIVDTVNWANANKAVSVLVLTGAGSAFSAGGNIKDSSQSAIYAAIAAEAATRLLDEYIEATTKGAQRAVMAILYDPEIAAQRWESWVTCPRCPGFPHGKLPPLTSSGAMSCSWPVSSSAPVIATPTCALQ